MLVLGFPFCVQLGIQPREMVVSIFRMGLPTVINQDDFLETCPVAVSLMTLDTVRLTINSTHHSWPVEDLMWGWCVLSWYKDDSH